jgi:hypothetical protein
MAQLSFAPLPVVKGHIAYRSPTFGEWGGDDWTIRIDTNGHRVLTAYCEMEFKGRHVARSVIYEVDEAWHPQTAMIRLGVNRTLQGSAWYHFTDTTAECQAYTHQEGRLTQTFPITRAIRGFGSHPLQADAWLLARFDYQKGGTQHFTRNLLSSTDHLGSTGPMFQTTNSALELVGAETVTVEAGAFDCWHLRFVQTSNDHPPYDIWVTRDGLFLFVLGIVGGYMDTRFELVSLARS